MLEADLFIPKNGRHLKPTAIFVSGSGDSQYQVYNSNLVYTIVRDVFLQQDMAVLLVNKRGLGASEGNYTKNDIQGRVDDIYAAVTLLQAHRAIDANNIGLVGHSQGGWTVSLATAQHPDIAFFIKLAGPATSVATNMADNYWHGYRCDGYTGEKLEEQVAKQMRLTRRGAAFGKVIPFGMFGFDAGIIEYDPEEALQTVRSPGLFVFAENDRLVTPDLNLDRLDEIFDGDVPEHLTAVTISGANHSFILVNDPCEVVPNPYERPQSAELVEMLNDWLAAQGY